MPPDVAFDLTAAIGVDDGYSSPIAEITADVAAHVQSPFNERGESSSATKSGEGGESCVNMLAAHIAMAEDA